MNQTLLRVTLTGLLGVLVLAAPAGARPGQRDLQRTYPIASRLCARTAAGHAPKQLQGQQAQVEQACATLASAYSSAVAAALQAQATFRAGSLTAVSQRRQACRQARIAHDPAACSTARQQQNGQLQSLRQARRAAFVQYHTSIEAARKAFWATIHGLRGGAQIAPDQPQPDAPVPTGGQ